MRHTIACESGKTIKIVQSLTSPGAVFLEVVDVNGYPMAQVLIDAGACGALLHALETEGVAAELSMPQIPADFKFVKNWGQS